MSEAVSAIDLIAAGAVDRAHDQARSKEAVMCAVIRLASDRLAALAGDDAAVRECAKMARRHAEKAARRGVRP